MSGSVFFLFDARDEDRTHLLSMTLTGAGFSVQRWPLRAPSPPTEEVAPEHTGLVGEPPLTHTAPEPIGEHAGREVARAACVLVLETANFHEGAARMAEPAASLRTAAAAGRLVAVALDDGSRGAPSDSLRDVRVSLVGWRGDQDADAFRRLVDLLHERTGTSPESTGGADTAAESKSPPRPPDPAPSPGSRAGAPATGESAQESPASPASAASASVLAPSRSRASGPHPEPRVPKSGTDSEPRVSSPAASPAPQPEAPATAESTSDSRVPSTTPPSSPASDDEAASSRPSAPTSPRPRSGRPWSAPFARLRRSLPRLALPGLLLTAALASVFVTQLALTRMAAPAATTAPAERACRNAPGMAPEMVLLPGGAFRMGSPAGESGQDGGEGPVHVVAVPPFAIGRCEVTVGEFRTFVEATGYETDAERDAGGSQGCNTQSAPGAQDWNYPAGTSWRQPNIEQTAEHPVVCVSWNDTQAYVRWLSQETGRAYRLPSESEWEYTARGGSGNAYWWGAEVRGPKGEAMANCDGCGSEWDNRGTAPVGSFSANGFGLQDTSGNAWEWTQDCWHGSYEGAPADGSAWLEAEKGDCGRRVLRGGGWFNDPRFVRAANRLGSGTDYRGGLLGFRLAQDLE